MKHKRGGPAPKVDTQSGTGGSSAKINYAVGSGSRPGGGKMKIPSSFPSHAQNIRSK